MPVGFAALLGGSATVTDLKEIPEKLLKRRIENCLQEKKLG